MPRRYWLAGLAAAGFTILDQVTKIWAARTIPLDSRGSEVIPGFFRLVHYENSGAAFSMLDTVEYRMVFFAIFTVIALGVIAHMVHSLDESARFDSVVLGILAAGAVGNGIDRLIKQEVTDFLLFYGGFHDGFKSWLQATFGTYAWPAFNVADICIVVGIGLFVLKQTFFERDDKNVEPSPPAKVLDE